MIITCEECGVSFNFDEKLLKPSGSKVRCSKCKKIFTAFPPKPKKPEISMEAARLREMKEEGRSDISMEKNVKKEAADKGKTKDSGKKSPAKEIAQEGTEVKEIDISSLEMMLELDGDKKTSPKETAIQLSLEDSESQETEELELDFGSDDAETAENENLELELNLGDDDSEGVETEELKLDLDLGNDDSLENAETQELYIDEKKGLRKDAPDELDFKLEEESDESSDDSQEMKLDLEPDEEGADLKLEEEEEDFSELEKMLQTDDVREDTSDKPEDANLENDEEIDLLDLEKTLEMDLDKVEDEEEEEEDLDVELELADDTEDAPDAAKPSAESDDDLDMSDIEKMLEMNDEEEPASAAAGEDDDLELEFVSDSGEPPKDYRKTDEEEDIELEFEEQPTAEATSTNMAVVPEPKIEETPKKTEEAPAKEKKVERRKAAPPKPPREKKAIGKVLLIAALAVIVLIALFVGIVFMNARGLKIPYISPYIGKVKIPYISSKAKPTVKDPLGKLNLTAINIEYKFVESQVAGTLFVITGEAKNDYTAPRSFIKLRGIISAKGKVMATSKEVYAGNVLSEKDVSTLDADVILNHLQNKFGENRKNLNIAPGGTTPFMIVFFSMPEAMDEYAAEIVSSSGEQTINESLLKEESSYITPLEEQLPVKTEQKIDKPLPQKPPAGGTVQSGQGKRVDLSPKANR